MLGKIDVNKQLGYLIGLGASFLFYKTLEYGENVPVGLTSADKLPFKDYRQRSPVATVTAPEISFASRGGRVPAVYGGIMGVDGRRQYGFGSIGKSCSPCRQE